MNKSPKPFTIIGIPIDCSGRLAGVERMPAALRAAGLVQRLGWPDRGDLPVTLDDPRRDPVTSIIAFEQVCAVSSDIRTAVGELLVQGERPFIIGGCCTLLIGLAAAVRDQFDSMGLAFVDGHLDFYDGQTSPTGEAADMELAILSGLGPQALTELAGPAPLWSPQDIVVLGYRDGELAAQDGAPDPAVIAPDMRRYDAAVVKQDPTSLGRQVAARFETEPGRFWLHLDFDVLDQEVMPAVDYLMPGGLKWEELTALVRPLITSPALMGVDLTIYNPALDAGRVYAGQIVEFLGKVTGEE